MFSEWKLKKGHKPKLALKPWDTWVETEGRIRLCRACQHLLRFHHKEFMKELREGASGFEVNHG